MKHLKTFEYFDIDYMYNKDDIVVNEKNKKSILNIIIKGLKKSVSMIDTIKKENINLLSLLDILTDEDKKLINTYHKKISDKPENIKNAKKYGSPHYDYSNARTAKPYIYIDPYNPDDR